MKIKKALEAYYGNVKAPERIEYDVLTRVERSEKRKWKRLALFETFLVLLLSFFLLYEFLKPKEYQTMGLEGVRVVPLRDVGLEELSHKLSKYKVYIEGPYEGRLFVLKGDRKDIESFLKEESLFRKLN